MARQKGMLNLSGNLEPLAGAPLDSRDITPTVADLYIASNWPYKYIGMKTTVTATGDTYRLVNLDVTQESSWVKEGSGESGASSLSDLNDVDLNNPEEGEALLYDGEGGWTNGPAGQTYSDFTGATSQSAGSHGLVPAPTTGDISKFLKGDGTWATVPMPSFDYSNTSPEAMNFSTDEKVIGTWIDGKPLYQKTVNCGALPNATTKTVAHHISNIDIICYAAGVAPRDDSSDATLILPSLRDVISGSTDQNAYIELDKTNVYITTHFDWASHTNNSYVTLRYTKTTDSAVASGEKIVGQWVDGKPVYQKIVTHGGRIPLLSTLIKRDVLDNGYDILRYTKNIDHKLPSGYTEIEYIENPQSEYLDTGYIPDTNGFRVVGDLTFTGFSASWDDILGIYNGGTSAAASFGRYNTTQQFRMTGMGGEGSSGNSFVVNTKYDFDVSFVNGSKYLKIDGATVIQPSGTANCPAYSIYFFAANKQNAPIANEYFVGRLGRTVIFNSSDSLVKYYIPCTRDSDDAVGMYETVGGQFFTSSGSGSFIAGNPVI